MGGLIDGVVVACDEQSAKDEVRAALDRGAREKERVAGKPRARVRKEEAPYVEFSDSVEKALAEAEVRDVIGQRT